MGHSTPSISFSIDTMVRRRRSKASRIACTADRSPVSAVTAARCETFATFDVACDCRLVAAFTTSFGPIIQPTRQPVIAYVLATPFSTTQVSASSGTSTGIDTNRASSYTRCS
ncbi:hypothetical protein GCM10025868_32510 [Angustibacter aerolatus]|uniref:Uncharacterized protein n=1 Tax=Angustibacter aerolatus TaxID=1162965 RepID=A0ABQ6JID4_9ACTN|nr:hypothetical protein GCM10025868_32510 [Angustibacter aerolatus]